MIGEFGSHQPVSDAPHSQRSAFPKRRPQRRDEIGRSSREQLLDGSRQRAGQAERGIDRRRVVASFDRRDQLPADARSGGKLGLCQAALETALTQPG